MDVARRESLGRLLDGPPADAYPEFADDLRTCCAAVVTAAARVGDDPVAECAQGGERPGAASVGAAAVTVEAVLADGRLQHLYA